MNPGRILIIDDSAVVRDGFADKLHREGFQVDTAENGKDAIFMGKTNSYDVVVTDIVMPKVDGMEVLSYFRKHYPKTPVIIISGHATLDTALQALRSGAYDYLLKPVKLEELTSLVHEAVRISEEKEKLKDNLQEHGYQHKTFQYTDIVGDSPAIQKVFRKIEKVARTDCTVLIYGESGTGKELIARAIHFNSTRRNKPLVPINCAAIPDDLLESELFGHEKGAFTHAFRSRPGRFELAAGGTIFLDEIGEMPPKLQVKLLRVLQERTFERVGGFKTLKVDVRIIAATNKDLEKAVKKGAFREDLYYRLNVVPIKVPPLRSHLQDLNPLVNHFLNFFCQLREIPPKHVSPEVMECFREYRWPGNVRELENLLERLIVLVESQEITLSDLPARFTMRKELPGTKTPVAFPSTGIVLKSEIEKYETELIFMALKKANGIRSEAARLLGINRTTLLEKLRRRGISLSSI